MQTPRSHMARLQSFLNYDPPVKNDAPNSNYTQNSRTFHCPHL